MAKQTRLYGEISKSEKQDDGTIKVWGYASAEVVDSDGETVTADAMKAAKEGYMAFANVREMHDAKKAAGVAIEYEVQDDGKTWFGAHVVDPVAVLKCETGVYKGFSIGARVPKGGRDGKVIKSIELREVSLVDRPANPEAVFTLVKAEGGADDDGETVQKGLWDVARFAQVLQDLGYMVASSADEANREGDMSPIPAALLAWLQDGAAIFQSMASEECAELLASLRAAVPAPPVVDVIAAAAAGGDLTKAGARFSTATKAALKAAHDACKAADKALGDLGYEKADDGDDSGKAATPAPGADELAKAAKARADEATAQIEELAKAAGLTLAAPTADDLTKAAITELVKVRAEHEALKKRAAPPKGYANAQAVSKASDRGGPDENELPPVVKADGSVDEVATLMKRAQSQPVRLS
jgi:phage head maturation protease